MATIETIGSGMIQDDSGQELAESLAPDIEQILDTTSDVVTESVPRTVPALEVVIRGVAHAYADILAQRKAGVDTEKYAATLADNIEHWYPGSGVKADMIKSPQDYDFTQTPPKKIEYTNL